PSSRGAAPSTTRRRTRCRARVTSWSSPGAPPTSSGSARRADGEGRAGHLVSTAMANSVGYHEDESLLSSGAKNRHRAIASLMEELEAVDWYDQRVEATDDPTLADVLRHNRDEEKEHAAMTLEWLRRHDPELDEHLRTYLFTTKSVLAIEEEAEHGGNEGDAAAASDEGSLGIGNLRAQEPV